MSFALDVNVLLYASDESSPKHARAREFLERCAAGPEMMCLAWITLFAYLRMATHPRIFERPLSPRAAEANVEALIELPHVRTLAEEQGFWTHYREVTGDMHARRNQVPDAHLAALMRQHGVRVLYTGDRDFKRFGHLEVRDPFWREA